MKTFALLSDDAEVNDAVLSAAAAASTPMQDQFQFADCVFASVSKAGQAKAGISPDAQLWIVGFQAEPLMHAAMALNAQPLLLPAGNRRLAEMFVGVEQAVLINVMGGSGGVGASTLALGLAQFGAKQGFDTALVECDAAGPGVDLLLGGERTAGWRWPAMANAHGEMGDIRAHLPKLENITVVAQERGTKRMAPTSQALRSVLDGLARTHQVVVCDSGRAQSQTAQMVRKIARNIVVCHARVSSVASTQNGLQSGDGLVVCKTRPALLNAQDLAQITGAALVGVVPYDIQLVQAAEQGMPPWLVAKRAWRKAVAQIFAQVTK